MTNITKNLKANWKSGLTVALVSIPLAVSLSVASGTSPVIGILTAIWAGLVMSIFGGSNYNIVGPTGALSGILAAYAFTHGANSIAMLAIVTGAIILFAYALKLERYLIFVPASTIHGFTLGVAFIIALNQLNNALGLSGLAVHEKFFDNLIESVTHLSQLSVPSLILFTASLAILFLFAKFLPKLPGVMILTPLGILLGYLTISGILGFDLITLGEKYSNLQATLFVKPQFFIDLELVKVAATVAIVAIIETMISAKVADGMTKTKHKPRREMLALGLANVTVGLFGGMPSTAALARTSLNIKAGATDKMSAMISSIGVGVVSILFLSYFQYIPLPMIAAILVFVAIRMIEHQHFMVMWKHEKKSFVIAMLVAAICIYEDPIVGILFGTAVALLLFIERLSHGQFDVSFKESGNVEVKTISKEKELMIGECETLVYSIKGQLVYINGQTHISRFENNLNGFQNIVIRLREVSFVDLDGVDALDEIIGIVRGRGKNVYLTGISPIVERMLEESEFYPTLKSEGFVFEKTSEALKAISKRQG